MDTRLHVPVLRRSLVRLEPLAPAHAPNLARAAEEDRSAYRFTLIPRAGQVREYVPAQLTRPGLSPFAQVRLRDGRAVGCTSYCTPRLYPERPGWYATEIGWTPLAACGVNGFTVDEVASRSGVAKIQRLRHCAQEGPRASSGPRRTARDG